MFHVTFWVTSFVCKTFCPGIFFQGTVSRSELPGRPMELFMCSVLKRQGYGEGFRWMAQYINWAPPMPQFHDRPLWLNVKMNEQLWSLPVLWEDCLCWHKCSEWQRVCQKCACERTLFLECVGYFLTVVFFLCVSIFIYRFWQSDLFFFFSLFFLSFFFFCLYLGWVGSSLFQHAS